jgi:hypothetical protein
MSTERPGGSPASWPASVPTGSGLNPMPSSWA